MDEPRRERIRKVIRNRTQPSSRFDSSHIIQETELQLWRNGHDSLDKDSSNVDQALIAAMAKGHLAKQFRKELADKRDASREQSIDESIAITWSSCTTSLEGPTNEWRTGWFRMLSSN